MEMMRSGHVFDLSKIPGVKLDKHSTGGVGDGVSLSLAPLAASLGILVPMMSGRGLGHTGGTLDKLESIPGFNVFLQPAEVLKILAKTGAVFFGQTDTVVPADKRMYALRDVTATVDSVDLIASSIMSKKLAEGVDGLVLDVKTGRGAFMRTRKDAENLAKAMIAIAQKAGRKTTAFITNMDQPLGGSAGNAPEVVEHIELLKGRGAADLTELVAAMTAEMLVMAGKAANAGQAAAMARENIDNGKGLTKLKEMIEAQSGDPAVIEDYTRLSQPASSVQVLSGQSGWIRDIDPLIVGKAALSLGAGRKKASDAVDHSAGFKILKKRGDRVSQGEPLALAMGKAGASMDEAVSLYLSAVAVGNNPPPPGGKLILKVFRSSP